MKRPIDLIRIAVLMSDIQLPIDPIKNATISNAFFVNHLYANLISVNDKNEYVADLAKNFYWENQTLIIEFDENSIINAADAEFNIKRSFVNDLNDHGDLWKVLCNKNESNSECLNRISISKNLLKIDVANKNNLQMIIPILSSINYKIVPIKAFDSTDYRTAKIIDRSITSGKYYLKNNNLYELFPNESALKADDTLISKIQIIDANSTTIEHLVENNLIDVISTTVTLFEKHIKTLEKHGWLLDKTHDIKVTIIVFSRSAISKTTISERKLIGNLIKTEAQNSKTLFPKDSNQYFQNFSQGYLTDEQSLAVNRIAPASHLSTEIQFSVPVLDRWQKALQSIQNLKPIIFDKNPSSVKESERPDIFVIASDVSFETSYSQISYLLKKETFKSPDKTADQIINEYLSFENNDDKIKYINKLHYEVISNCYIYPIWSSPYITAVSSKFSSNMSKYNSRTLAWKITKN